MCTVHMLSSLHSLLNSHGMFIYCVHLLCCIHVPSLRAKLLYCAQMLFSCVVLPCHADCPSWPPTSEPPNFWACERFVLCALRKLKTGWGSDLRTWSISLTCGYSKFASWTLKTSQVSSTGSARPLQQFCWEQRQECLNMFSSKQTMKQTKRKTPKSYDHLTCYGL